MKIYKLFYFLFLLHGVSWGCSFEQLTFSSDFDMGRLSSCKKQSDNTYQLFFKPESTPINNSPWYAFKVESKKNAEWTLKLTFSDGFPRYLPKISTDGIAWKTVPFSRQDDSFVLSMQPTSNPVWIAGQELLSNANYTQWLNDVASNYPIKRLHIAKTKLGRVVEGFTLSKRDNNEWLVLIGRQHPPEVTGALAMFPFVKSILEETSLSTSFLERFNVLVVSNLNPDGVALGNWRFNANNIDLNRDWLNFSQAETQGVRDRLNHITQQGGKIVFAVDFHSTQQDIFYTMPKDYGLSPATFSIDWLKLLRKVTAASFVVRTRPGSSPGRGIFKQFIADTYGVHAITYEMGDNTNRQMINHVAISAAETLMTSLLKTQPQDFVHKPKVSEVTE